MSEPLNQVVGKAPLKMTFEQRTEEGEGKSHVSREREKDEGKVLRHKGARCVLQTSRRLETLKKRDQGNNYHPMKSRM